MYLAYSLLLTLGLIVLLPYFLFQALIYGKYVQGLGQRCGWLTPVHTSSKPVIWLHCVSVGETQAARPLVARLRAEFSDYFLVVSTITTTGQALAKEVFRTQADAVIYFPFDWSWTVRRALRVIRPDVVLIMETELWPNFLRECGHQGIPVALLNGRVSSQSFRRYHVVRYFLRKVFSHLRVAVMQSEHDAERISALGLPKERRFVTGNLKFDVEPPEVSADTTEMLRRRFDIHIEPPLILAASTHGPEEKIILKAFHALREKQKIRLMIAPRRPERFQEVANLIQTSGLPWARRTGNPEEEEDRKAEIMLLDTIGELPAAYSLAALVFVGGSIVARGGHNVLEPAATGVAVVTGHHTNNFQAIMQLLVDADAIVQLPPVDTQEADQVLTAAFAELLNNNKRRAELGKRAKEIVQLNQGAADRTLAIIRPLLRDSKSKDTSSNQALASSSSD